MSEPSVSVIIPTYDRGRLLEEAVASVHAQSFSNYELIVVDDGSTEPVQGSLPGPVTVVTMKHCGFPGRARNVGARGAIGRYLAFLDSDDIWRFDKLDRQLAWHAAHPGVRISHTREVWLRGEREVSQAGQRHVREGDLFSDSLRKCIIGPSTVLLERSLFEEQGGFRNDLEIAEDYEFWLRVVQTETVGYVDEPLTIKRAGHEQLSEKYGQIEIFRINALRDLIDRRILRSDRMVEARRELSRKCSIFAAGCRKRGRDEDAFRYEALAREYG